MPARPELGDAAVARARNAPLLDAERAHAELRRAAEAQARPARELAALERIAAALEALVAHVNRTQP